MYVLDASVNANQAVAETSSWNTVSASSGGVTTAYNNVNGGSSLIMLPTRRKPVWFNETKSNGSDSEEEQDNAESYAVDLQPIFCLPSTVPVNERK